MPFEMLPPILALVIAALTATPLAGWAERICAAAMLLPALAGATDIDVMKAMTGFHPSLLLVAILEFGCMAALARVAFTANRRFPLVMAAAALIGLIARALQLTPLAGGHLHLLFMPAMPLLVMALALGCGIVAGTIRRGKAFAQ